MKRKRKKLSGFTLVELIIVVAIFSGIAVGALAMIRPAMQLFNKTSSQESAGANIDNIARYLQDNLRYADRVNVYQGYGETDPKNMLDHEIDDILPMVEESATPGVYKKTYKKATPLQFFRNYYYSSPSDYEDKNVNVMQIDNNGKISIYTFSLKTGNEDTAKRTSINNDFYEVDKDGNYRFTIDGDMVPKGSATFKIPLKIRYDGTIKDNTGKTIQLEQESEINLNFVNISKNSKFDIIKATLPNDDAFTTYSFAADPPDASDKDKWGNDIDKFEESGREIKSRAASAFKNFSLESGDADYTSGGYTYIVYTVPQIIMS